MRPSALLDIGGTGAVFLCALDMPTCNPQRTWLIVPGDERAHRPGERLRLRAAFEEALPWEIILIAAAGDR